MGKYRIHDFCEELNYTDIILYVHEEINFQELYKKLQSDLVSHLYRFDSVKANRLFYIENCDLQNVDNKEIAELFDNGYSVLQLRKDSDGFFIKVPDLL